MEQNARLFHVPHLLGRTGRALLPLRHPEIRPAGEAIRRFPGTRSSGAGSMLMRGFDDTFMVPHSRHTTIRREEVESCGKLKILASSPQAGIYALSTEGGRQIFITGHSEYDAGTLQKEYLRDKTAGLPIHVPENYFPDDDDTQPPRVTWPQPRQSALSELAELFRLSGDTLRPRYNRAGLRQPLNATPAAAGI